jgi:hypothetical protein
VKAGQRDIGGKAGAGALPFEGGAQGAVAIEQQAAGAPGAHQLEGGEQRGEILLCVEAADGQDDGHRVGEPGMVGGGLAGGEQGRGDHRIERDEADAGRIKACEAGEVLGHGGGERDDGIGLGIGQAGEAIGEAGGAMGAVARSQRGEKAFADDEAAGAAGKGAGGDQRDIGGGLGGEKHGGALAGQILHQCR